jgi:hypothetical protein
VQLDDLEPVVEILPEGAVCDPMGQVAVGGGQNAHIHRSAFALPDATDLPACA